MDQTCTASVPCLDSVSNGPASLGRSGPRSERDHVAQDRCEGKDDQKRSHILPISPNFLSSNTRNRFLLAISLNPRTVLSLKSLIMSACVLSRHIESPTSSASDSSSEVVETSAERHKFDFFIDMRCKR